MSEPKNLIFSTTRQWNPGDELILAGVRKILGAIGLTYNSFIYNRNPDLRDETTVAGTTPNRFYDNSVADGLDCSFADYVIFAGTPEWCSARTAGLYRAITQYSIPTIFLGVGGGYRPFDPGVSDVVRSALLLTARDSSTLSILKRTGFKAQYLPCPALLSADTSREKAVQSGEKLGLIFQAPQKDRVYSNGLTPSSFEYQLELFKSVIDKYRSKIEISLVCHYVDEPGLAKILFPGLPVHYSHNSDDYLDIYAQFDAVMGFRVHGIGAAASVGVPGLAIAHDARGGTCKGFLADIFATGTQVAEVVARFDQVLNEAPARSERLKLHKRATLDKYSALLKGVLEQPRKATPYGAKIDAFDAVPPPQDRLDRTEFALEREREARRELRNQVSHQTAALQSALSEVQELSRALSSAEHRVEAALSEARIATAESARLRDQLSTKPDRADSAPQDPQSKESQTLSQIGALAKSGNGDTQESELRLRLQSQLARETAARKAADEELERLCRALEAAQSQTEAALQEARISTLALEKLRRPPGDGALMTNGTLTDHPILNTAAPPRENSRAARLVKLLSTIVQAIRRG